MKIGRLNKRITIQEYSNIIDEEGFHKKEWVDLKTVWGSIKNYNNKEKFQSDTIHDKQTCEVLIRYTSGVTNANRIKYNNTYYNILSVQNINEQNKELLILCEVLSSGS